MLAKWQVVPVRQTLVFQGLTVNLSRQMSRKCLILGNHHFFSFQTHTHIIYSLQLYTLQSKVLLKKPEIKNNKRPIDFISELLYTDLICDQISNINYNSCSFTAFVFVTTHKMFHAKYVNVQARRPRVQCPVMPLNFSIDLMLLATLWPWSQLSL
jgi:hypothetical protein